MSNIRELKPRPVVINKQTVALLRDYLAMAERGDLIAVALAGVARDGGSVTAGSESDCVQLLIGSTAVLQHRLISGMP